MMDHFVVPLDQIEPLAYPQFADPLTEKVIRELFTPTPDELRWVRRTYLPPFSALRLPAALWRFTSINRTLQA
jgi:hypothetical protein